MPTKMFLNGDEAVAHGVRLAKPNVVAAYPITPQTIVVERIADFVANGQLDCEYVYVESEHSALSNVMGASVVGARTFTATSSQGLLYMSEIVHYVGGGRLPVVMMNANRSLATPWNVFGDQRDFMSQRDAGWIMMCVENAQEAIDMTIQAYKVAEDERLYIPFIVALDGFVNTHTYENVIVPDQEQVDKFLPPLKNKYAVDFDHPISCLTSASPAWNTEMHYQKHLDMQKAIGIIEQADKDYAAITGRSYGGLYEEYRCEDAEYILVAMGSVCGTLRLVVDELRSQGFKAGFVKVRYMRPFPIKFFTELAQRPNIKAVGILDRDISFGAEGALAADVKSAMAIALKVPVTVNFIAGLGGRDLSRHNLTRMYKALEDKANGAKSDEIQFIDLRWAK
jgi:pyruvate ferredoxin oxidoreductase alpha subunit